jgi:hypothetical protein
MLDGLTVKGLGVFYREGENGTGTSINHDKIVLNGASPFISMSTVGSANDF